MHGGTFQIVVSNGEVQLVTYSGTGSQWQSTDKWIMNSMPRQQEVEQIEQKPVKPVEQNDEDVPMIEEPTSRATNTNPTPTTNVPTTNSTNVVASTRLTNETVS